jgi:hypothetical protein
MVEDACDELSNSTRLRQLLGIVLQFGNRLNTAGAKNKSKAGAFTLDSLLKLSQAKAFDKKTTFLHYVVLIVQRNNELLLNFTDDLPTVLKADKVFWDQCLSDLEEVENQLENVRRISLHEARVKQQFRLSRKGEDDDDSLGDLELTLEEEVESLRATPTGLFTLSAIKQVSALRDKVEDTRAKFNKVLEYFGQDEQSMQPHELFTLFCTFCGDFNKAKEETFANAKKKLREERKKARNQTPNGKNGKQTPNGKNGKQTPNGKNGKPPSGPDRSSKPLRASSHQPNMSKVITDCFQTTPPDNPLPNGVSSPQRSSNKRHVDVHANTGRQGHAMDHPPSKSTSPSHQGKRPDVAPYSTGVNNAPTHNKPLNRPMVSPKNKVYSRPGPEMPEEPVPRGMQEAGRFEELASSAPAAPWSASLSREATNAKEALRLKARNRRQRQIQNVNRRKIPIASNIRSVNNGTVETRAPESDTPDVSPSSEAPNLGGPRSSAPTVSPRHAMRHRRRLDAMKQGPPTSSSSSFETSDVPASY